MCVYLMLTCDDLWWLVAFIIYSCGCMFFDDVWLFCVVRWWLMKLMMTFAGLCELLIICDECCALVITLCGWYWSMVAKAISAHWCCFMVVLLVMIIGYGLQCWLVNIGDDSWWSLVVDVDVGLFYCGLVLVYVNVWCLCWWYTVADDWWWLVMFGDE